MTTPKTGYTREGFLQLLHERLAAAHLAGLYREGFPASSLKLLGHYFDQIAAAPAARSAEGVGGSGVAPTEAQTAHQIKVESKLLSIMVGGCTCLTKTPELQHHDTRCHYRLASEALELVAAAPTAPAGGEAPVAWYDPANKDPGQSVTFDKDKAANWPHLYRVPLYTHPSADLRGAAEQALEALKDMNNGWKYIRSSHGDLYGVGWDRAQDKADAAIASLEAAISRKGKTK